MAGNLGSSDLANCLAGSSVEDGPMTAGR